MATQPEMNKDVQSLQEDLQKLRDDVAAMTKTLRAAAGEIGEDALHQVRDRAEKARVRATHAAESLNDLVAERPWSSVLAAVLLGLVLGLLFRRR